MEVVKCLLRKDGVKMAIIPKKSDIKGGDLVLITNNFKLVNKILKEEKNDRREKTS